MISKMCTCPQKMALVTVCIGAMLPGIARAQQPEDKPIQSHPWRLSYSPSALNIVLLGFGAAGNTLGLSYDFRQFGSGRDPAALSAYLALTGNNLLQYSQGSTLQAGVSYRTKAAPLYAVLGAGISQTRDYDIVFDATLGHDKKQYYKPDLGLKFLLGTDIGRTPFFLEFGAATQTRRLLPGGLLQFGVRL